MVAWPRYATAVATHVPHSRSALSSPQLCPPPSLPLTSPPISGYSVPLTGFLFHTKGGRRKLTMDLASPLEDVFVEDMVVRVRQGEGAGGGGPGAGGRGGGGEKLQVTEPWERRRRRRYAKAGRGIVLRRPFPGRALYATRAPAPPLRLHFLNDHECQNPPCPGGPARGLLQAPGGAALRHGPEHRRQVRGVRAGASGKGGSGPRVCRGGRRGL